MITPLDIENKRFGKQMVNGYSVNEVDDFLDELTLEYSKLYKENAELKERREELDNDVGKYKNIETTLQNTLLVAKQQAEQILKDAELEAKNSLEGINSQIIMKEKELEDLKKQFDVYKAKMESLLISQLELLKDIKED